MTKYFSKKMQKKCNFAILGWNLKVFESLFRARI